MSHSKQKNIPIGIDDYKELIEDNYLHIDKTLLIKEFWDYKFKVALVTRPRRFGKSISLSMLRYFFEKTEKSTVHLFENTKIWQEEGFKELQGTYPVFHISFKDIKATSWNEAYSSMKTVLANEIYRVLSPYEEKIPSFYKKTYESLIAKTADITDFSSSILFTTDVLEKILNEKTIVLIDEYDTPITHAYLKGYYEEATGFMRNLFSEGLKGNIHLKYGFMTGVVRTARDGILSGLNNPQICTMLDVHFSDKFGFTEEETFSLLQSANRIDQKEEVKAWYNGYVVGAEYLTHPSTAARVSYVYNPWSILKYLAGSIEPKTYWANTGSTELLERLIAESSSETQEELAMLLEGKPLENKLINEDVILLELDEKEQEPWSFLLFAGYITATSVQFRDDELYYTLSIPNKEILKLYKKLVVNAIGKTFSSKKLTMLQGALIEGNISKVSKLLEEFISSLCSCHDLPQNNLERSLHLFVLGLLASLSERYVIKSNLESGDGRYDIAMHPKKRGDPAIIIEFKKGEDLDLELLAIAALEQIEEKNYAGLIRDFGYKGEVLCYGVAAFKKHVVSKLKVISL